MPKRALWSFIIAAVVLFAFSACDYLFLDDMIPNRGPEGSPYDLLKAVVAAGLAVAIVAGIRSDGQATRKVETPDVAMPGPVLLNLILATFFVLLFLASPSAFNWLGQEDNAVEYLSALACLAGSAFFVGAFLTARRTTGEGPRRLVRLLVPALGAVALFLIGMEEVSWFQRILGFGTPESFSANLQGEVNLHNFLTTPVHTVYRLGAWAVLILLPFMVAFGPRGRLLGLFDDILPPPWIAAMSAPIACFNYNAWPFMPTQVVAFSSILMMAAFWLHAWRGGKLEAASLFGAMTVLMIVAQAVFLLGGDRFVRHWDVTEYQEFFMAAGLAAVAWVVRARMRILARQPQAELALHGARSRF